MNQATPGGLHDIVIKTMACLIISSMVVVLAEESHCQEQARTNDKDYFTLDDRTDLRYLGGKSAARLLTRIKGKGHQFGAQQRKRYCELKSSSERIQWVLNDLETGEIISQSADPNKLFFGASVSKLFVAAALLNKQKGELNKAQLNQLVKMIVVSNNRAWKELQRQTGNDGSDDSGRAAIDNFVQKMGYADIKAFQGWMKEKDGTRIHGNELNARQLANFLYDTYQRNYAGAEVLWKVMHATRTGRRKIDKYTPSDVFIGGKTGTYHGPNVSPKTIRLPTIRAQNHAAVLNINGRYYGLSILTNTGSDEAVAILGGGLMREYLGIGEKIVCR